YLAPVLPRLATQTAALLNKPIERWDEAAAPLVGTPVGEFEHMLKRVEPGQFQAMIDASREEPTPESPSPAVGPSDGPEALVAEPLLPTIGFDDFTKVDLRVARVIAADEVPKSKK